jgi:hypothetical protein
MLVNLIVADLLPPSPLLHRSRSSFSELAWLW